MVGVVEIIFKNGGTCYELGESFNTEKRIGNSGKSALLNFASMVEYYDFAQCVRDYENDDETDEDGCYVHSFSDFVESAERNFEEGLFIHLSDQDESFLDRNAKIRLMVDKKSYTLSCFFAPRGSKNSYSYTAEMYLRINPAILKGLALSSSIMMSYESEDYCFEELDISKFKNYALAYYEQVYIENLSSPEEKESLQTELAEVKEAKRKQEEEKRAKIAEEEAEEERKKAATAARIAEEEAEREREKAVRKAALKAKWDEADSLGKVKIIVKHYWFLILIIIYVLYKLLTE